MNIIKFIFPLAILNLITLILVVFGITGVVPAHINLVGIVDGFGFRWFIPILGMIPIFMVIIYIVYIYISNTGLNRNIEDKLIPAIVIFLIVLSWIPVIVEVASTNISSSISNYSLFVEIISFILVILAIFFVFMGYYLEKIKSNKTLGIKTPWTINNEIVWIKTHRLASYTSMIGGFVLLVYSLATFISENMIYAVIGLVIAVFLVGFIPIIYSYYEYKKLN